MGARWGEMSEYQYYEFQAVDRPLSREEIAAVRALSTRATITPTRFVNEYQWGDFKGDPLALMEVSEDGFRELARRSATYAPRVAAVLEGGYNLETLPLLVAAAHEGFSE